MDISCYQWDKVIEPKIMNIHRMHTDFNSTFVCEWHGDTTTMKFTSDDSNTDMYNANIFANYLKANRCAFKFHIPRSLTVNNSDIIKLFL